MESEGFRTTKKNLEINRYNLLQYTEEKNEAQRWAVFLKVI